MAELEKEEEALSARIHCALIKTELDSMPSELDEQRRKIMQLEIEESALKKETDNLSKERLEALQKELAELRDTFNTQKAQWDNEKHSVEKLQKLRLVFHLR